MVLLAAIVKAFGQGTAQPALQVESLRKLGKHQSGLASSSFYIGANLGQGFGPLIGGSIASLYGYRGMFNFSAALLGIGVLGYFLYTQKSKH
ncbi:MFS transporter [Paenibacillus peoriae]|uniref:MFS transporter n=1 Tax=Paenibacillus peoriae TaxID=59893 RepID=UPI0002F2F628